MSVDTSKITTAANDLSSGLTKGGTAAKTLGQEIVNTINALDAQDSALEARIAALEAGGGSAPPPDATGPTGGLVTALGATKWATTTIDGLNYVAQRFGGDWSQNKIDDYTIRYEIRQGDVGWDATNNSMSDGNPHKVHNDTVMAVAYRIMIEPGDPNTAPWFTTVEWHNDDTQSGVATSPPAVVEMLGDKWSVVYRYCRPGGNPQNGSSDLRLERPWTAPSNIVRGRWYVFEIDLKMNQTNGYLRVKIDGAQVVNYSGPLGYGYDTYIMCGLYRQQNAAVFAGQIRNFTVNWA